MQQITVLFSYKTTLHALEESDEFIAEFSHASFANFELFWTRISVLLSWQHPEWTAKHAKPEVISIGLHTTKGQIKYPIYVTPSKNTIPCIFHSIKRVRSFTTAFVGQWCNLWVYTIFLKQKGVVRDIIQDFFCGKLCIALKEFGLKPPAFWWTAS